MMREGTNEISFPVVLFRTSRRTKTYRTLVVRSPNRNTHNLLIESTNGDKVRGETKIEDSGTGHRYEITTGLNDTTTDVVSFIRRTATEP